MAKKVISQVNFEIGQVDQLLETYAALLEKAQVSRPDLVEVTAIASVLHSFYNGVENIFLAIAAGIDSNVPTGDRWHRDLLMQMAEATVDREPVVTAETANQLADYLGFRHFYRHSYSFFLEWEELEKLVIPLVDVWSQTKAEFQAFLDSLGPAS